MPTPPRILKVTRKTMLGANPDPTAEIRKSTAATFITRMRLHTVRQRAAEEGTDGGAHEGRGHGEPAGQDRRRTGVGSPRWPR